MSGAGELRECIWLKWHGAATKPRIQQFSIEYAPQVFFGERHKPLCVRAVRRCTLDSAVLSIVHREGGCTEIGFSLAMEGCALVWAIGRVVGLGVDGYCRRTGIE